MGPTYLGEKRNRRKKKGKESDEHSQGLLQPGHTTNENTMHEITQDGGKFLK